MPCYIILNAITEIETIQQGDYLWMLDGSISPHAKSRIRSEELYCHCVASVIWLYLIQKSDQTTCRSVWNASKCAHRCSSVSFGKVLIRCRRVRWADTGHVGIYNIFDNRRHHVSTPFPFSISFHIKIDENVNQIFLTVPNKFVFVDCEKRVKLLRSLAERRWETWIGYFLLTAKLVWNSYKFQIQRTLNHHQLFQSSMIISYSFHRK